MPAKPGPGQPLTRREREIALLVAGGLTPRDVARLLFLSVRTVDHHMRSVYAKAGVHNRAQFALWAAGQGLADGAGQSATAAGGGETVDA